MKRNNYILNENVILAQEEICEALYEKYDGNTQQILDYADKVGMPYSKCKGCEVLTPTVVRIFSDNCAICGGTKEMQRNYKTPPKVKFKVEVNPFTKRVEINAKIKKVKYTIEMYYSEIDEWNSFEMGGKVFDIHFDYDVEFSVTIYKVKNGSIVVNKQYLTELIIKL